MVLVLCGENPSPESKEGKFVGAIALEAHSICSLSLTFVPLCQIVWPNDNEWDSIVQ